MFNVMKLSMMSHPIYSQYYKTNPNTPFNELKSLGVATKKVNELNDLKEISNLASNIKHALIQDYNNCE